ncbi:MAG: Cobalt-zinc-cadmium resistance protein [Candidatus Rifleibacterium amylolyticum]|nr:MAG: Cobalt-zinc-cadmium resistance protein [Candidatus Rifleibacterium amylolyticum]
MAMEAAAGRDEDIDHPYGHRRIEAMISVLIGFVLGLASSQ